MNANRAEERKVEDIVSAMLNDVEQPVNPRHVHVFRKEYKTCLIGKCNMMPNGKRADERYP